jgi:hypothetical protein
MARLLAGLGAMTMVGLLACGGGDAASEGAGGSAQGGSAQGGSAQGGNAQGGNAQGGSAAGGNGAGGTIGANPHPLYPPLDLDALPGFGGVEGDPYQVPELPQTSQSVTVTSTGTQAAADLLAACQMGATAVDVPDAAGDIGVVTLGNVDDCDVTLGANVAMNVMVIGSLPGPTHAPSHRIRIRGGQIGNLLVAYGSSDVVFDGVAFNNGVQPSAQRNGNGLYLTAGDGDADVVDRFAVVNSFIRMVPVDGGGGQMHGNAFLGGRVRNALFANNNVVTAGNHNSWAFRFGGGANLLLVDNTVRVSFHKMVRLNTSPVDYVYIAGGTWMRESTLSSSGTLNNDSFAQLSGSSTDHVYVHDLAIWLLPDTPASFGATYDAVQNGRSWQARNIDWHAVAESAMSPEALANMESACANVGADCDYGADTHSFDYDPALTLPTGAWRDLPTFDDDDPDNLPVAP